MKTNILPLPMAVGLLVGLVLIVGWLQGDFRAAAEIRTGNGSDRILGDAAEKNPVATAPGSDRGTDDHYREIYRMGTRAEKAAAMRGLTAAERREVFVSNTDDTCRHFGCDGDQRAFIDLFLDFMRDPDKERGREFERRAIEIFPDEQQLGLTFYSIGPAASVGRHCMAPVTLMTVLGVGRPLTQAVLTSGSAFTGGCTCSIGSGFNWSCDTPCRTPRDLPACDATPDGCGFGYLFPCDGQCPAE